jgi:dGTPase
MINRQITDFLAATSAQIKSVNPACANDIKRLPVPVTSYSDEMQEKTRQLKKTLRTNLYQHYRVHRMSTKAKLVIKSLFQAFMEDIRLLPTDTCKNASNEYNASGDGGRAIVIADYIAGMTDRYAIREYERIFDPIKLT